MDHSPGVPEADVATEAPSATPAPRPRRTPAERLAYGAWWGARFLVALFLFVGALFVVTNFALSRLSRRLEIKQRERTGVAVEAVTGLEDQVALDADTRTAR